MSPASRAMIDKHILYEASVQGTGVDIELITRVYKRANGLLPVTLREDFCGTALLACAWADSNPRREAWGVDLDRDTLEWARAHRLPALGDRAERVHLAERDVLDPGCPPVDVVAALNFSYMIFHERRILKAYFSRVFEDLNPGGVFLLDIFGGPHSQDVMEEVKAIDAGEDFDGTPYPAFKYVWDQAAFNAVDQRILCHIHFRGKHIEPIEKAFTYDWRLWSITEITDLLLEAGFQNVDPYFEAWSEEYGSTDGILRRRTRYEGMLAWISYLAAEKGEG